MTKFEELLVGRHVSGLSFEAFRDAMTDAYALGQHDSADEYARLALVADEVANRRIVNAADTVAFAMLFTMRVERQETAPSITVDLPVLSDAFDSLTLDKQHLADGRVTYTLKDRV